MIIGYSVSTLALRVVRKRKAENICEASKKKKKKSKKRRSKELSQNLLEKMGLLKRVSINGKALILAVRSSTKAVSVLQS